MHWYYKFLLQPPSGKADVRKGVRNGEVKVTRFATTNMCTCLILLQSYTISCMQILSMLLRLYYITFFSGALRLECSSRAKIGMLLLSLVSVLGLGVLSRG